MSRMLITVVITYVLTRLFYWLSGFEPVRAFPGLIGYLLDLAIWILAAFSIFWSLSVLRIGKVKNRKTGMLQD